nr:MAG TPA: hypothetical protein [Caudoviricetes sp.]
MWYYVATGRPEGLKGRTVGRCGKVPRQIAKWQAVVPRTEGSVKANSTERRSSMIPRLTDGSRVWRFERVHTKSTL